MNLAEMRESQESDKSDHIGFLYKAIDDCQAIIRHLDTKAAVALIPLGFVLNKLISEAANYFRTSRIESVIAVLVAICALVSIVYIFRILFPRMNPVDHVAIPEDLKPAFFISGFRLETLKGKKTLLMKKTHAEYIQEIESATPAQLRSVAAAELLKVSFIRNVKFSLIGRMSLALLLCLASFLILIFMDIAIHDKPIQLNPSITNNFVDTSAVPGQQNLPVKKKLQVTHSKTKGR